MTYIWTINKNSRILSFRCAYVTCIDCDSYYVLLRTIFCTYLFCTVYDARFNCIFFTIRFLRYMYLEKHTITSELILINLFCFFSVLFLRKLYTITNLKKLKYFLGLQCLPNSTERLGCDATSVP